MFANCFKTIPTPAVSSLFKVCCFVHGGLWVDGPWDCRLLDTWLSAFSGQWSGKGNGDETRGYGKERRDGEVG
ncbi:hypothetical protein SLA2020_039840 [Shorea laevis]